MSRKKYLSVSFLLKNKRYLFLKKRYFLLLIKLRYKHIINFIKKTVCILNIFKRLKTQTVFFPKNTKPKAMSVFLGLLMFLQEKKIVGDVYPFVTYPFTVYDNRYLFSQELANFLSSGLTTWTGASVSLFYPALLGHLFFSFLLKILVINLDTRFNLTEIKEILSQQDFLLEQKTKQNLTSLNVSYVWSQRALKLLILDQVKREFVFLYTNKERNFEKFKKLYNLRWKLAILDYLNDRKKIITKLQTCYKIIVLFLSFTLIRLVGFEEMIFLIIQIILGIFTIKIPNKNLLFFSLNVFIYTVLAYFFSKILEVISFFEEKLKELIANKSFLKKDELFNYSSFDHNFQILNEQDQNALSLKFEKDLEQAYRLIT